MVLNQDYLTHLGSTHGGIWLDTMKGCSNNVEMPNILQGTNGTVPHHKELPHPKHQQVSHIMIIIINLLLLLLLLKCLDEEFQFS